MSILSRTTPKVRHAPPELSKVDMGVDCSKVAAICRALVGEHDLDDVRNRMIDRYAQVIVQLKDDKTGTTDTLISRYKQSGVATRLDYAAASAIIAGQQEITRLFLFNSVVRQRARLFTEPGMRFEYESDTVGEIIADVREEANANLVAQRWDSYADGIGSCALYISDAGGVMQYSEIPPNKIWVAFAELIGDDGRDRPTNTNDLDEASVVVIEIASNDDKRKFAAWMGPSASLEYGRHVVYYAQAWHQIPEVGTASAFEYSISGQGFVKAATDPANPLTLIARSQNDTTAPVYPIVILYGDSMQSGLLPTTSTLYDVSAEFDLMGSMTLGAAGRGARGMQVFKRGTDTNVPDNTTEGMVLLGREQELAQGGWPAAHSKDAMDVIASHCRWVAESFNVPGWLVTPDQAGEVPSGVALEIMTLPLTENRNARVALNKHSVSRRFAIERAIINGVKGTAAIPWEERETWNAGERVWPKDPEAVLRTWKQRMDLGEANLADLVMETRKLNTMEEAWNWIDEHKKDEEEHAELMPKPAAPPVFGAKPSLAERLGGGRKLPPGIENQDQGPSSEKGTKVANLKRG